jgi:hypothetical protein
VLKGATKRLFLISYSNGIGNIGISDLQRNYIKRAPKPVIRIYLFSFSLFFFFSFH